MKAVVLRRLPDTLQKFMRSKNLSAKELAQKANMSYSSLMPILNGSRECGISKLVALADALDTTPDVLLQGLYHSINSNGAGENVVTSSETKFFAVFISIVKVTYCLLYDIETSKMVESVQQFPMRCGDDAEFFIGNIISTLEKLSQDLNKSIELQNIAVFTSVQQYGRKANREKIQNKCNHLFAKFIMESDAISNQNAFIGQQNGICISINDGCMITYSTDNGKNIARLQGYGFPVSDTAGNYWIGCEAIKHVVNVKEHRERSTLISDRLLALFNDDLIFLCASALEVPHTTYLKASSIVKELISHDKSIEIIKKSFDLLFADIQMIDSQTKTQLPIFISGELNHLYENFFPKERLIQIKERQSSILLKYGLSQLRV